MTPTEAVRLALGAHADAAGPAATSTAANSTAAASTAPTSSTTTGSTTTGTATTGPATALTQREHEVVRLLAAGLSNREIAAKLFISPATAARHVANILAKLGFSSRSQVAAWAAAQPAGQLAPNSALTDSPS
jgi:DNA-binding NarL/FixJ family response regulator